MDIDFYGGCLNLSACLFPVQLSNLSSVDPYIFSLVVKCFNFLLYAIDLPID